MQYQSSYYWQQEVPAQTSLVVQQLMYRKGKIPIFLPVYVQEKELSLIILIMQNS